MAARDPAAWLDAVLLSTVVFASIPTAITLDIRIGGVPALNAFYLFVALAAALTYGLRDRGRPGLLWSYLTGWLFMSTMGFVYRDGPGFDTRWAMQDLLWFLGVPIGIAVAKVKGGQGIRALLHKCYIAGAATFSVSLVLLSAGYIRSAGGSERQLDPAMYTTSFLLAMAFPCVWSEARSRFRKITAAIGLALCLEFAILSATRSTFIIVVSAVICTGVVEIKRKRQNLVWLSPVALLIIASILTGTSVTQELMGDSLLAQRFGSTDVEHEDRFEELAMMIDQMGVAEWLGGAGFGTGFYSPITLESDNPRADGPHIGIGTVLYKGGAPLFVVLVLAPCVLSMFKLLVGKNPNRDPYLAGVAIYFAQASISGGWAFIPLFLLGTCLQMGLVERRDDVKTRFICWKEVAVMPSEYATEAHRSISGA